MIEHELTQHQIRRNRAETLSVQFYDDGTATDPGTVTIGITDEAGTEIVSSGTSTTGSGSDAREYELSAQSDLNRLTVTWTSDTYGEFVDYIEVVGEFLFTIREARTFDGSALENTSHYPTADIQETRARITDEFEHVMGVSHIPRYNRQDKLFGRDSDILFLPDIHVTDVRKVEYKGDGDTTWSEFDSDDLDDLAIEHGGVVRRRTHGDWESDTEYRVTYEYGYDVPPLPIKRAALRLLVSYLGATRSSWDPRATSMSTEAGVISIATPGRAGSIFGLPEVDAIIQRYSETIPGVA